MIKMPMSNGEELTLSIRMKQLRELSEDKEKKKYTDSFFKMIGGIPTKDPGDSIFRAEEVAYLGHLCAKQEEGNPDQAMSFDDFEENLPEDISAIVLAATALINPKQSQAFEKHLKSTPED